MTDATQDKKRTRVETETVSAGSDDESRNLVLLTHVGALEDDGNSGKSMVVLLEDLFAEWLREIKENRTHSDDPDSDGYDPDIDGGELALDKLKELLQSGIWQDLIVSNWGRELRIQVFSGDVGAEVQVVPFVGCDSVDRVAKEAAVLVEKATGECLENLKSLAYSFGDMMYKLNRESSRPVFVGSTAPRKGDRFVAEFLFVRT